MDNGLLSTNRIINAGENMEFWWSGETDADVGDAYSSIMTRVAAEINRLLKGLVFEEKAEEWAFIGILLGQTHVDFGEVVKRSSRGKSLEFRLKIPHSEFLSGDANERTRLIFDALSRSITLMEKLRVSHATQETLHRVLVEAQKNLGIEVIPSKTSSDESEHATTTPKQLAISGTFPKAEMIKLYDYDRNGNVLHYWEAWKDESEIVVHWGSVGTRGSTRTIPLSSDLEASSVIQREANSVRARGYREAADTELFQLIVQFRIDGMGTSDNLEQRYKVEEVLNQCLGWTGLGFCDGGDIGSGTMNVFCFVVDSGRAIPVVTAELSSIGLLDHATIALSSDDHEEVVWPANFQGKFAI